MGEEREDRVRIINNYEYGCGDGTGGVMAAENHRQATKRAEEVCRVHNGVEGRLQEKPETEQQRQPH